MPNVVMLAASLLCTMERLMTPAFPLIIMEFSGATPLLREGFGATVLVLIIYNKVSVRPTSTTSLRLMSTSSSTPTTTPAITSTCILVCMLCPPNHVDQDKILPSLARNLQAEPRSNWCGSSCIVLVEMVD